MGTSALSADEVREFLQLEPHPTCGFVNLSYVSTIPVAAGGLPVPFADGRPAGSALYFMVTRAAPVHLHCIRNDQLYHRYLGDPLEVLLLLPDGTHRVEMMGDDLARGQHLQLFLPGGTFHTARLLDGGGPDGGWFLGASTEWPGVDPTDVVIGDPVELRERFAGAAQLLDEFLG